MQDVSDLQRLVLDSPSDPEIRIAAYRGLVLCLPHNHRVLEAIHRALDAQNVAYSPQGNSAKIEGHIVGDRKTFRRDWPLNCFEIQALNLGGYTRSSKLDKYASSSDLFKRTWPCVWWDLIKYYTWQVAWRLIEFESCRQVKPWLDGPKQECRFCLHSTLWFQLKTCQVYLIVCRLREIP